MSNIAISVENISKQYRLGEVSTGTISHDLNRWWAKIRGKEDPFLKVGEANDRTQKGTSDLVWALKDINFDVKQGEVLGIIGRNGAGKSTLLKVLSKVTQPTTGNFKVRGRIASLLEVGTGFHPELTGRENIYLNGAILGMTKSEISRKFDEILDFSGVERYVDTPVKRYSSGMYVRLAFAVAAHLEPEILIVDEVLAVGDAEFQKKCLGKMKDVSGEGRTVLFVSHNMGAVRGLCTRGVFMNNGTVGFTGSTPSVIDAYFKSNIKEVGVFEIGKAGKDEVIVINKVQLKNAKGDLSIDFVENDDLIIELDCFTENKVEKPQFWISIRSQYGNLFEANALTDGSRPDFVEGKFKVICQFKGMNLMPQTYYIHMGIRDKLGDSLLTKTKEIGTFNIDSDLRLKGYCGDYLDTDLDSLSPMVVPYSWNFDNKEYYEFK